MKFQYWETELGIPLSDSIEYHAIELGKDMAGEDMSDMTEIEN